MNNRPDPRRRLGSAGGDVAFRTKSDWAYTQLRDWIQGGALESGQKLDQEWLAAELGISRIPLRHALVKLEADGLIESRPHQGAIVAPLSLEDAEDIYASRRALEGMLAEVGATRCDSSRIARMREFFLAQEKALTEGDVATFVGLDRRFHMELYGASGYARSLEVLERLRDLSDRYVRLYLTNRERAERSLNEHEEILSVCEVGNPEEVKRVTQRHVSGGLRALRSMLGEETTDDDQPAQSKQKGNV